MINLILAQVQPSQSLEEATKKADELEKQISSLQDTLISAQNDKISSLTGDIGAIVGIFGLIFAVLSLLSAIAIIYIQKQNRKATENIKHAKEIMSEARQVNVEGNEINKSAANELKEVQKKIKEVDFLMDFSRKQSLVNAKINQCRTVMEIISFYLDINTYTVQAPVELTRMNMKTLQDYRKRMADISNKIDAHFNVVNLLVESFHKNFGNNEEKFHVDNSIESLNLTKSEIMKTYEETSALLEESREFYENKVSNRGATSPVEKEE